MAIRFFAAAVASLGLAGGLFAQAPATTAPAPIPVTTTAGCCGAVATGCNQQTACCNNQGRSRIGFRNRSSNQCCNAPVQQQCCSAPVAQVQTCCAAPVNTCNTCCNTGMTYRTGLIGRRSSGNYVAMAPMTYQPMMVSGTTVMMPTTGVPMTGVVQAGGQQPSTTAPRAMTGGTPAPAPVAGTAVIVAPVSGDCGCTNGSYNTSSRRFFNRGYRRW